MERPNARRRAYELAFESDSDEEYVVRRPRWIRERVDDFNNLDEIDFITRYRLSKRTALSVLETIKDELEFPTDKSKMQSMENLPSQLILRIATYLHPKDVVACSAVSKSWREKFNVDAIWKPHLQFPEKYYKIQEKYKDMILCPTFSKTLEPLCPAREQYIRDQCLRFNWRAGQFTVEEIKFKHTGKIRQTINTIDDEGNYWLFSNSVETIEVWNITNKPHFQSCISKVMPNNIDSMYVFDTKVTLVFSDFVLVYSFEHPKYELAFQCCFHFDDESPTEDLPGLLELRKSKPYDVGNQSMKHLVNGKILIGFTGQIPKSFLHVARMHVWNLETLVKLYRTNIINPNLSQSLFEQEDVSERPVRIDMFEGDSHNVLVLLQEQENEPFTILLSFNIQGRCIARLRIGRKTQVLWTCVVNSYALVFGAVLRSGFYFCLVDSQRGDISTKNATKLGLDVKSQVHFNYPVYVQTADTLFVVEVKDDKLNIRKILENQTFRNDIISVCGGRFMFTKKNQEPMRLWDMDSKCPIVDLPEFSENMDIHSVTCLKNVEFPPKVTVPNIEKSSLYILSFW